MTTQSLSAPGAQELTDDALDDVAGAVTCATALKLAKTYIAIGDVLQALGSPAAAAGYYGRANGITEGACT